MGMPFKDIMFFNKELSRKILETLNKLYFIIQTYSEARDVHLIDAGDEIKQCCNETNCII